MEKWITIKGKHILLKDGETPKQALERFKNGMDKSNRLYDNKEIPKMEKSNKLYDNDIPKMEKEKWLTKSSKQSIVYLPKKEYGRLFHIIKTEYKDKIPEIGGISIDNYYYVFGYNKSKYRMVCYGKIDIEKNKSLSDDLEDIINGFNKKSK